MRIAFVCDEYPPGPHGGIGTLTRTLARGLAAAGHEVRVVGTYPASLRESSSEDDRGVDVRRLRSRGGPGGWVRSRFLLFRRVAAWARRGEIDLIEVPDWSGPAALWPALPIPVVVRLSGSASYFARELGKRLDRTSFWLERESLRRADFRCSESHYLARRTREVFGLASGADEVIYNPVEAPAQTPPGPRDPRRVVFAATLTPKKGILSVARAWPRVLAAVPDALLEVYGKDGRGESGPSMQAETQALLSEGGGRGVVFRGPVSLEELLEAFATARAVVLPSYAEGFSLTPIHAMAAGCPTIYTRRGSGPEVIDDGTTGLLVDPDDPAEIAAAIVRLLTDDALAARLGPAGRDAFRTRFSPEALIPRNESFYRACLERFTRRRRAA